MTNNRTISSLKEAPTSIWRLIILPKSKPTWLWYMNHFQEYIERGRRRQNFELLVQKICVDRNHQSTRKSDVGIRSARANIHTNKHKQTHTFTHSRTALFRIVNIFFFSTQTIQQQQQQNCTWESSGSQACQSICKGDTGPYGLTICKGDTGPYGLTLAKVIQDRTDYSLLPVIAEQVRCLLLYVQHHNRHRHTLEIVSIISITIISRIHTEYVYVA